jgi:hypothetical protein
VRFLQLLRQLLDARVPRRLPGLAGPGASARRASVGGLGMGVTARSASAAASFVWSSSTAVLPQQPPRMSTRGRCGACCKELARGASMGAGCRGDRRKAPVTRPHRFADLLHLRDALCPGVHNLLHAYRVSWRPHRACSRGHACGTAAATSASSAAAFSRHSAITCGALAPLE